MRNLNGSYIIINLMMRENGATIHDLNKAGYKNAAMSAIRMAERKNYRTRIVYRKGQLTRYYAFKSSFKGRR